MNNDMVKNDSVDRIMAKCEIVHESVKEIKVMLNVGEV